MIYVRLNGLVSSSREVPPGSVATSEVTDGEGDTWDSRRRFGTSGRERLSVEGVWEGSRPYGKRTSRKTGNSGSSLS